MSDLLFKEMHLIREVQGTMVYCDPKTGRFTAKVGGKVVTRPSIAEIERLIAAKMTPVAAFVIEGYRKNPTQTPKAVQVVRRRGRKWVDTRGQSHDDGDVYLMEGTVCSELQAIHAEYRTLEERYHTLLRQAPRFQDTHLAAAQAKEGEETDA